MKKIIRFNIWGPGWQHAPHIDDSEQHRALIAYAEKLQLTKGGSIKCPPDHPGLPLLFKELQEIGWTPYYGYVPPELKKSHFSIRTIVTYDEVDIDQAELLRLPDNWGEWPICGFERRNVKLWVGLSEGVGKHTGQGWDQTHGNVDGWHNYFIHPKVRAHFESAGLHLCYHPLEWDNPKAAKGDFWEIDTPHIMPPCLTPISEDGTGMRFFEDAGCEPAELHYRRSEVAAIGSFDAAWTKEEIGVPGEPREGGHHLVVSQRFRRACLDYGLDHVEFIPVRLVD
jgi:hypothetical protein